MWHEHDTNKCRIQFRVWILNWWFMILKVLQLLNYFYNPNYVFLLHTYHLFTTYSTNYLEGSKYITRKYLHNIPQIRYWKYISSRICNKQHKLVSYWSCLPGCHLLYLTTWIRTSGLLNTEVCLKAKFPKEPGVRLVMTSNMTWDREVLTRKCIHR